jgi:uncharacterized membrane protein
VTRTDSSQVSGLILSARRALTCLAVGLLAGGLVAWFWEAELGPLLGWTVAAGVALWWVWRISWRQDSEGTKRLAEEEGRSHSTDMWVVLASLTSLVNVVVALNRSSGRDLVALVSVLLSVASVTLSWALVNTVFALKYARLYYVDEPDAGGFDFKQEEPPEYSDFAYLAFTVGMSFAVAETEPVQNRTRKVVLGHALLSYLFGTGVVAVAVNLVTNFAQ